MNPPSLCPYCSSPPTHNTDGEVHHILYCFNPRCLSEAMQDGVQELTEQQARISWEELCEEERKVKGLRTIGVEFEQDNVDTKEHYER